MATTESPLQPLHEPKDAGDAPGRLLLWFSVMMGLVLWAAGAYAAVRLLL